MDAHTHSPDPAAFARRRSTISSSAYSTTSSSSPEFTTDAVITPDSEEEGPSVIPKIEELDEEPIDDLEDAKPPLLPDGDILPIPRKRGRPRKHPIPDHKKASHVRSKTGCATCRRRKKKCGEERPSCLNCEKNNVDCEWELKGPWRAGKSKALTIRNAIPAELPMLVEGVDGPLDQMFFHHFTAQVGKVLSLTDHQNPFLEIIVPMAMGHEGLMHSLLYLSGSCLMANETSPRSDWEERQEHHSSRAMRLLQQDLSDSASTGQSSDATVADPSIAQTLLLCLQTVCAGDLTGTYRFHLNAMKEMLTQRAVAVPNEQLRQFILEFLLYHDYSSSITSLSNPLDQRSIDLMEGFKLPEFMIQPQAGTLLGVMDGLFGFISRIRKLRDQIRWRRAQGAGHWWDADIIDDAFAIDDALRAWKCVHPPESSRYAPSLLYRQCTWIYLHRTIQLSQPSPTFKEAVDQGLQYLRMLPVDTDDGSTQSILLMPLFLLGCAAFEPEQRPSISEAFQRLQSWSSLGNIRYAREIVEQVWQMMDEGREQETWDWETIIARRGWDFLVT